MQVARMVSFVCNPNLSIAKGNQGPKGTVQTHVYAV